MNKLNQLPIFYSRHTKCNVVLRKCESMVPERKDKKARKCENNGEKVRINGKSTNFAW